VQDAGDALPAPDSLYWRQQFSGSENTILVTASANSTWRWLAGKVLHAAGLDTADEEEAADTYCELLSQAAAGLAHSLSSRADREVLCLESGRIESAGDRQAWMAIRIAAPDAPAEPLLAWVGPALADLWKVEMAVDSFEPPGPPEPSGEHRTLDLLLDVELPVSVSFGRSQMPIKDVLKLTTGSVIELDRAVTEPVDLVVNNYVIARGEVVVVDGNYGVRIAQIMSREDRVRSLR
jgi:flagellar motor switch protein FliN/FliY